MRLGSGAVRLVSWALISVSLVGTGSASAQSRLDLKIVSSRPEMVSGGDALLRIDVPEGVAAGAVRLTLNGADITSALRAGEGGRFLTGRVTGLTSGANTVAAAVAGGPTAQLTLVNHAITGPVLAGPHEQPFVCETEDFKLRAGGTLGAPLDANCSVATRVDYLYRSTAGGALKPLADPASVPADVAVATVLGRTVPYVVRLETGTINRAIYEIAVLHNPASEPAPDVLTRPAGWNGRLIYVFGPGCEPGWYHQGNRTGGVEDDSMLREGYALASSSLNVFGNNCSELLAAETMMMVKERFIEAYGEPLFTMGWGGSGGAMQQYQIADNYPGLLDGIIPQRSFPDATYGSSPPSIDARLLKHYFDTLTSRPYSDEQKRRIAGFGLLATMNDVALNRSARITPTEACPEVLPAALRYDAVGNPKGARCTLFDHAVNIYGRDPRTGFARRAVDNVGLQYGLAALNDGTITKEQFLELNEKVGGFDVDGRFVPERTVGDLAAIRAAYRSGRMTNGGGGLATTPIIDYRAYMDDTPEGDVHLRFHSFSTRERLMKANGHADNQIMLQEDRAFAAKSPVLRNALRQMDQWLTALEADRSADPLIVKVRRAKPADLVDACWTREPNASQIVEKQVYGSGRCDALYPSHSFPVGVAGGPLATDIIKCQLKPIDGGDYKVTFTAEERTRLQRIFAGGVCDWSKPGVEQQPMAGTWQSFGPTAAGTASAAR